MNPHHQAIIDMLKRKYNYTEEYSGEAYYTWLMAVSVKLEKEGLYRARIAVMTSSSPYCDGMEQLVQIAINEGSLHVDFYDNEWYECTPELQGSMQEIAIDWVRRLGEVIFLELENPFVVDRVE